MKHQTNTYTFFFGFQISYLSSDCEAPIWVDCNKNTRQTRWVIPNQNSQNA